MVLFAVYHPDNVTEVQTWLLNLAKIFRQSPYQTTTVVNKCRNIIVTRVLAVAQCLWRRVNRSDAELDTAHQNTWRVRSAVACSFLNLEWRNTLRINTRTRPDIDVKRVGRATLVFHIITIIVTRILVSSETSVRRARNNSPSNRVWRPMFYDIIQTKLRIFYSRRRRFDV